MKVNPLRKSEEISKFIHEYWGVGCLLPGVQESGNCYENNIR